MIKLFENFKYGDYIFNNEIVEYINEIPWSDQIKIFYRKQNNKIDSVILDDDNEFETLFKPYDNNQVSIKHVPTSVSKPITKTQLFKIVYTINDKIIETIKDNISNTNQAYAIANKLKKDFRYKYGKIKVIPYKR